MNDAGRCFKSTEKALKKNMRLPGIEPRSTAWKATMLTVTPQPLGFLGERKWFILYKEMSPYQTISVQKFKVDTGDRARVL